jgi:hypothetical protein
MGCGIGCGALVVLIIVAATAAYLVIRDRMQSFADAGSAGSELERRYGKPSDFIPEPGAIPGGRISVFLQAREKAAPARVALEESFRGLSQEIEAAHHGSDSIPQIAGMVRHGFGVLPKLGEFQAARTRAMLESGIGPGEYLYIYVLAYYSWLGKSPADGPLFRISNERDVFREESDRKDVRGERRERLVRHIRREFTAMFRNQIAKLQQGRAEAEPDAWIRTVRAELTALENNPSRIPWQEGLPAVIESSLRPFRVPLEGGYSPAINPLELNIWTAENNRRNPWDDDWR